ncbi:hypothetical protein ACX1C1_16510 [Paenibacillus sp. strain BS8-2]
MSNKTNQWAKWTSVIAVTLIAFTLMSVPSRERFEQFIEEEYGIVCTYQSSGELCHQDGAIVDFTSSHFRNAFGYASYEKKYKHENGAKITTRTLGMFGMLFVMKDGYWWEVFN